MVPAEGFTNGGFYQASSNLLFSTAAVPIESEETPIMESPVPVPLSLNPNIAIEAAKYSNTLAVDLVAQEDMPGSSRSMSPRSRASCSSKGSPKTKRPSNGKGKCAYPLGCNKYRQNGTRFCVKHGGVRRCAMPGCPNAAKRGDTTKAMFCIRHGGGKSCRVPGCGVSARGSTGYCYKHRNLTSAISRKDSTASTASGSELDQASQLTPVGSAEEVSGGDVVDFSIDLASSYLDATCWEAQPATGECQTNLASLDFMALSDEKWTSFVEPLEPLPELLTNHINSDASDKLYLF